MYEARGRFEWEQTSAILVAIMGIMHDPKKGKLPSPNELNPFINKKEFSKTKASVSILKDIFVKD
jgi:hypothetical protein